MGSSINNILQQHSIQSSMKQFTQNSKTHLRKQKDLKCKSQKLHWIMYFIPNTNYKVWFIYKYLLLFSMESFKPTLEIWSDQKISIVATCNFGVYRLLETRVGKLTLKKNNRWQCFNIVSEKCLLKYYWNESMKVVQLVHH